MRPLPLGRPHRAVTVLTSTAVTAVLVLALAPPASAGVTKTQKLAVATDWTQPTAASANAWLAARGNQKAWSAYAFDWSTDYCSDSPDQPLGFDFRLPCARHDFGHRNFTALGVWAANENRVDTAFRADMFAVCAKRSFVLRVVCDGVATTYYDAVRVAGAVTGPRDSVGSAAAN